MQGWNALHHAAQNGNEATVELLLKGGEKYDKDKAIDPNLDSGADRSPLGVALSAGMSLPRGLPVIHATVHM